VNALFILDVFLRFFFGQPARNVIAKFVQNGALKKYLRLRYIIVNIRKRMFACYFIVLQVSQNALSSPKTLKQAESKKLCKMITNDLEAPKCS
jgi:hypothetical protein